MEIIYKKLIRDNIPEIIAAHGKTPIIRTLSDGEYLNALNHKLSEEVSEYLEDNCLDELCDILEVAFAIAGAKGYTGKDIEDCRHAKNLKNGAFEKKLFLEKVNDSKAPTNESQFICEEKPSNESVTQLISMIRAYAGEYFTDDFADDVLVDAQFQRLCYLKSNNVMISAIMFTCLDGYPHITAMATRRDLQNKGYGKRVMNYFIEYVSQLGFRGIELYAWSEKTRPVCASTQAFYKRVGFSVESEHMGLWAPGMITVKMIKRW